MALIQRKQVRSDNAWFTGSVTIPILLALGSAKITVAVTPAVSGDALAAGEPITPHALSMDLPSGIVIGQARATGTNQVQLTIYAILALAVAATVPMTFVAQR